MTRLHPLIMIVLFVLGACGPMVKESPDGVEGGRCFGDGTCDPGLQCDNNTCVNSGGGPNTCGKISKVSPTSDTHLKVGQAYTITWDTGGGEGTVEIALNRNHPSGTQELIFKGTPNDGSQVWNVAGSTTKGNKTAVFMVRCKADQGNKAWSAAFWIDDSGQPPQKCGKISFVGPSTAGRHLVPGGQWEITWSNGGGGGKVNIYLERDYPSGKRELLFKETDNDGKETWNVTGPSTGGKKTGVFWVECAGDQTNKAPTNAPFYIDEKPTKCGKISWVGPSTAGTHLKIGTQYEITWYTGGGEGIVDIYLERDFPSGKKEPLFKGTSNDGKQNWTVTGPGTNGKKTGVFWIQCTVDSTNKAPTNAPFYID